MVSSSLHSRRGKILKQDLLCLLRNILVQVETEKYFSKWDSFHNKHWEQLTVSPNRCESHMKQQQGFAPSFESLPWIPEALLAWIERPSSIVFTAFTQEKATDQMCFLQEFDIQSENESGEQHVRTTKNGVGYLQREDVNGDSSNKSLESGHLPV